MMANVDFIRFNNQFLIGFIKKKKEKIKIDKFSKMKSKNNSNIQSYKNWTSLKTDKWLKILKPPPNSQFISSLLFFLVFILHLHLYKAQNSPLPYQNAIACEGEKLHINCEPNHIINVIRANFGRFSLKICNEENNQTLPINCKSKLTHRLIDKECENFQNCTVDASKDKFISNECLGIPKYLEISYMCVFKKPSRSFKKNSLPSRNSSVNNYQSSINKNRLNQPVDINNDSFYKSSTTESAIYDSKNKINTNSNKLNELNKKLPLNIHLDNNQNPFLNGGLHIDEQLDKNNLIMPKKVEKFSFDTKENKLENLNKNFIMNNCPAIKIKGANFESTPIGVVAKADCPAGSTNFVSWFCASTIDNQKPMWLPENKPDFSKCVSLWLISMEKRLKDKSTAISKIVQELASVTSFYNDNDYLPTNTNSFIGFDPISNKPINSILTNNKNQQTIYSLDIYKICEIITTIISKLEFMIDGDQEKTSQQHQYFIKNLRRADLIKEILIKIQDTASNLLIDVNKEKWLDLQDNDRTLAISSLMLNLKKISLLFASIRPFESSNFARITPNLYIGVYVRQLDNGLSLTLPIRRNLKSDSEKQLVEDIGDDDINEKQPNNCCSVFISNEKMIEQSINNFSKFVFIIYENLGQLMPIEENRAKSKRSVSSIESVLKQNENTQSIRTFVVGEIISLFTQKESTTILSNKDINKKSNSYFDITFNHMKLEIFSNLTNFRCVQLEDNELSFSNNKHLSIEQAALAVVNDQNINQSDQITLSDLRFVANSNDCETLVSNLTTTICRCSKLGTFTLLADLGSKNEFLSKKSIESKLKTMLKLNRICTFSSAVSAILLLITIISFYNYKNNFRNTKTMNHLLFLRNNQSQLPGHLTKAFNYQNILLSNQAKINYLTCLFFLQCSMLISLTLSESGHNNQVYCRLSSLAIHYFLLAVFSWLLFDCFVSSYLLKFTETRQYQQNQLNLNQAQPLVVLNSNGYPTTTTSNNISSLDLQNSTRQYTLHTCKLLTYLLPLFIVVISSWIDPNAYCSKSWIKYNSYKASDQIYAVCWHVFDDIYIMFLIVPLTALLLASIVFLTVSIGLHFKLKNLNQSSKQISFYNSTEFNQKPQTFKHNLFLSNTRLNYFNVFITTCCWLSATFYLNVLFEAFENFHFKVPTKIEVFEETTIYSDLSFRNFSQTPDSNLLLFAFLFVIFNSIHCLALFIKLALQEGSIGQFFSLFCLQLPNFCSIKSKQHSLNDISQLYVHPNYHPCYNNMNINPNNLKTENSKYEPNQFNYKFDKPENSNLIAFQSQQQPLIPPPQLITKQFYNENNLNQNENLSKDYLNEETYENEDVHHFSENQSLSETVLANSDLQTSEHSDTESFNLNSKSRLKNNDQIYGNKDYFFNQNRIYGHNKSFNNNQSKPQIEHFYECIEDSMNGHYYNTNNHQKNLDEHQNSYLANERFKQNNFQNQHHFSDLDSEYENPIEKFPNKSLRYEKKHCDFSSNGFLVNFDSRSKLDQPLLPSMVRDNKNDSQNINLNYLNNFQKYKNQQLEHNSIKKNSFNNTIGHTVLMSSNLRSNYKNMNTLNEKEKNIKKIQQQLKHLKMQLAENKLKNQEELKDQHRSINGQVINQKNYLSNDNSVKDNSSV